MGPVMWGNTALRSSATGSEVGGEDGGEDGGELHSALLVVVTIMCVSVMFHGSGSGSGGGWCWCALSRLSSRTTAASSSAAAPDLEGLTGTAQHSQPTDCATATYPHTVNQRIGMAAMAQPHAVKSAAPDRIPASSPALASVAPLASLPMASLLGGLSPQRRRLPPPLPPSSRMLGDSVLAVSRLCPASPGTQTQHTTLFVLYDLVS